MTDLKPPTPASPRITVTGLLYAWYNSLDDHLFGHDAIVLSITAFVNLHHTHWGAEALRTLIHSRNRLDTILYRYLGPSYFTADVAPSVRTATFVSSCLASLTSADLRIR